MPHFNASLYYVCIAHVFLSVLQVTAWLWSKNRRKLEGKKYSFQRKSRTVLEKWKNNFCETVILFIMSNLLLICRIYY